MLLENADYIVLRHYAHSDYIDRMSGVGNCGAYAALYRKADLTPGADGHNRILLTGYGHVKRWDGRVVRSRIIADCASLGINFP